MCISPLEISGTASLEYSTSFWPSSTAKQPGCVCPPRDVADLYQDCPLSCGMCCSSDDPMEDLVCEDDPALHARQSAQCGHDSRMPVAAFKEEDGEIIRRRMNGCTYDNYSYTVVDAMVVSLTGKQLWQWTLDLIARPLGMNDMIRCMMPPLEEGAGDSSSGIPGCYVPPSFSDMYDVTKWPLWKGGPESYAWPGVSIVCSSEDLTRFIGMLVGKGGVAGVTVLSEASVNEVSLRLSTSSCRESYVHQMHKA